MTHFLELGASLYVPALRESLESIANRKKYPDLRSVIFCTEDSIRETDVPRALERLAQALARFEPSSLLRFVRVRGPEVLRKVAAMPGADRLTGFVLPKVTADVFEEYAQAIPPTSRHLLMITLETREVFDPSAMRDLCDRLDRHPLRCRVLSLRIGGNDLLKLLGMRRERDHTLYDSPLGIVVAQLVTIFRPFGFNLTAPVFEYLDRPMVLAQEVKQDLSFGLFGKTAIHPEQVAQIERNYRVWPTDLEAAERILDETAAPVFRLHNAMCEPATHRAWAELIVGRARIYGVHSE